MSSLITLQFKLARLRVESFNDESQLMQEHCEAMNCRDCEAFLQLGIDAFNWLTKADYIYRDALYSEQTEFDQSFENALESLFRSWLNPSAFANQWISQVNSTGYHLDNLEEFLKCESQVRATVKFLDNDEMTDAMRHLRDKAIAEHRDGKTAEFV